ncbi:hypothetical protein OSB04_003542 [Centaurea solstitialis]|uniref:Uncharacterized protein n=1 Tax=Centaurea solstitialis TaxID=347529 RepID=A0AA38WVR5_9ASTR|nr:hypothetical protein OSB04_003542 [Centaurea solstitialis]
MADTQPAEGYGIGMVKDGLDLHCETEVLVQSQLSRENEIFSSFPPPNSGPKPRSFAEVVGRQSVNPLDSFKKVIRLTPPKKFEDKFHTCLVGKVSSMDCFYNVMNFLEAEGCDDINIRYLGGFSFLLEFVSKEQASTFLPEAKETWRNWFSSLEPGTPDSYAQDRLVSLIILSFPPLARYSEDYTEIVKS